MVALVGQCAYGQSNLFGPVTVQAPPATDPACIRLREQLANGNSFMSFCPPNAIPASFTLQFPKWDGGIAGTTMADDFVRTRRVLIKDYSGLGGEWNMITLATQVSGMETSNFQLIDNVGDPAFTVWTSLLGAAKHEIDFYKDLLPDTDLAWDIGSPSQRWNLNGTKLEGDMIGGAGNLGTSAAPITSMNTASFVLGGSTPQISMASAAGSRFLVYDNTGTIVARIRSNGNAEVQDLLVNGTCTGCGSGSAAWWPETLTMTGTTIMGPGAPSAGDLLTVELTQDAMGGGGNDVIWGADFDPATPTTINPAANSVSVFSFYGTAGGLWAIRGVPVSPSASEVEDILGPLNMPTFPTTWNNMDWKTGINVHVNDGDSQTIIQSIQGTSQFTTDGIAAGMIIPASSTNWEGGPISGAVVNESTTTNAVALRGYAVAGANGTSPASADQVKNFPLNLLCDDRNHVTMTTYTYNRCQSEIDNNFSSATTEGYALLFGGNSSANPAAGSSALAFTGIGSGFQWPTMINILDGTTDYALSIGKKLAAGVAESQFITMYSERSGGNVGQALIYMDTFNGLTLHAGDIGGGDSAVLSADGHWVPATDEGGDLGRTTLRWQNSYVTNDFAQVGKICQSGTSFATCWTEQMDGSNQFEILDNSGADWLLMNSSTVTNTLKGALVPMTNSLYDLGTTSAAWEDSFLENSFTQVQRMCLAGTSFATCWAMQVPSSQVMEILDNAGSQFIQMDTVTPGFRVKAHTYPLTDNAYDLGISGNDWRTIYFQTSLIQNGTTRINSSGVFTFGGFASDLIPTSDAAYNLGNGTTGTMNNVYSENFIVESGGVNRGIFTNAQLRLNDSGGTQVFHVSSTTGIITGAGGALFGANGVGAGAFNPWNGATYDTGIDATVSVRKGDDSGACDLVFNGGVLIGHTC